MAISILPAAPAAAFAVALGCAAARAPGAAPQPACAMEAATMRVTLGGAAAPADAAGTVRTAACRLPAGTLARARAARSTVLRVEGVRTPPVPMNVLVFLNDPGAAAGAPTSRASYAGSFSLLAGGQQRVNLQVALGDALARALREREDVSVTLVAVDRDDRPLPGVLSFERLVLDLR